MRKFIWAPLFVFALVLSACGGAATTSTAPAATATTEATTATEATTEATTSTEAMTTTEATTSTAATSSVAACASVPANVSGKLNIAGSSALLPLFQLAATNYQTANKDVQIAVTAGGSGSGRSQVCQGKVEIGNSDVPLGQKDATDLKCDDALQTPVAIQAFAPVANKQGPGSVTSLSKEQLQGIFTCQITNWKDVGGDDQAIVVVNRAKGSGTRSNMAKYLYDGDDTKFCTGASEEDNSETVKQTVGQTPGAISYLGFAYLSDPSLVALSIDNVAATPADIQNGSWPIASPGYSITKGAWNDVETGLLCYVLSPEFQNSPQFAQLGFVPVIDAQGQLTHPQIQGPVQ
ncbi:MAG: phosphate ABC transporter substrate-binding protein [Caldilineaceae bacterium]